MRPAFALRRGPAWRTAFEHHSAARRMSTKKSDGGSATSKGFLVGVGDRRLSTKNDGSSASGSSDLSVNRHWNDIDDLEEKDDPFLAKALNQNRAWVTLKKSHDSSYFQRHAFNAPKYLWIGCADARVPANELIGEPPGTVFAHRNIANMVVNTDVNLMAVLQYAVNYLHTPHILVVGHYDCGGVKAAMTNQDHISPLENWLRNIRDVYRLHQEELNAIKDVEARQRRLVELNVQEQCLNVFKTGVVQRKRKQTHDEIVNSQTMECSKGYNFTWPRIHALVYDPAVGILNKLPINLKEIKQEMQDIYTIY